VNKKWVVAKMATVTGLTDLPSRDWAYLTSASNALWSPHNAVTEERDIED